MGTIDQVALELGRALAPLEQRLSAGQVELLFADLGLELPPAVAGAGQMVTALGNTVTAARTLAGLLPDLAAKVAAEDVAGLASAVPNVVNAVQTVVTAFGTIRTALEGSASAAGATRAPIITAFAAELPGRLLDYTLATYLEQHRPLAARAGALLGLVEITTVPASEGRPAHTRRTMRLDRLGRAASDPEGLLEEVWGWGGPALEVDRFLRSIRDLLVQLGALAYLTGPPDAPTPELRLPGTTIRPTTGGGTPGLAVELAVELGGELTVDLPIASDQWRVALHGRGSARAGGAIEIRPPAELSAAPVANGSGDVALRLERRDTSQPFVLLGQAGGSRLEATQIRFGVGASMQASASAVSGEVFVEAAVEGGRLVVTLGGADGFLTSLLPEGGFEATFDVGMRWSSSEGLTFTGSAGLQVELPLHLSLGPVQVDSLTLGITVDADGPQLVAAVTATGTLGPFTATIRQVGVAVAIGPAPGNNGNAGPLQIEFEFKPPTGVGLAIEAGPVSGGGFLDIDQPNGRYSGLVQLEVAGIQVTAIGLIDTRLPGGEQGFALLVVLSARFPPIQLGFGFTLTGLGGLLGVNRTVDVAALQAGIRTGAASTVLFPQDVVRNASRIISDLRTFFPPAQGQFLIGPMAELGWGTPTLLRAALGVILELPDPVRIVILGQISAALPAEDVAIVELNLDVLGVVDFGQKLLSIDASLHDSRVALYTVYGDMALRLSWADPPTFALSIGGLHPRFTPPPGFPELRRCTIELGLNGNPRLSSQSYLALTSNSLQVGASVELYAEAAGFNVRGWLGFDALVKFVPFSFLVGFSAGVELRRGTSVIAGIHLSANLSGPSPWHAWGEASISILFFEVSVGFDVTFGEARSNTLAAVTVWPELERAIKERANWRSMLPPAARRVASISEAGEQLLDPVGGLAFEQKVVPLNRAIARFGEAPVQGTNRFDVTGVRIGGTDATGWTPEQDYFPPAHFEQLTDDQKLSRPSFERMDAGVQTATDAVTAGSPMKLDVEYETRIVDDPWDGRVVLRYRLPLSHLLASVEVGGVALARKEAAGMVKFLDRPAEVAVADAAFVVASTDDLGIRRDITSAAMPAWAAEAALSAHLAANPADGARLQVVAAHEAEG